MKTYKVFVLLYKDKDGWNLYDVNKNYSQITRVKEDLECYEKNIKIINGTLTYNEKDKDL